MNQIFPSGPTATSMGPARSSEIANSWSDDPSGLIRASERPQPCRIAPGEDSSANQRLPSGPRTMPAGPLLSVVARGSSVTTGVGSGAHGAAAGRGVVAHSLARGVARAVGCGALQAIAAAAASDATATMAEGA
ncbi:MAG: hypothetical protein ACLQVI_42675 [Polyangiaceae bacterium]